MRVGDDESEVIPVTSGTPQGGILSALLFSMFIDDLSEVSTNQDIGFHFYADDSQFYISNFSIERCVASLNEVLGNILNWATFFFFCKLLFHFIIKSNNA